MKSIDILLVLGYFRSATAFLSIIRHLSPNLRIGVMQADNADSSLTLKTGHAQALFMRLCVRFGAEVIEKETPVRARLMVVQQFPYPDEVTASINRIVHAERRVGLMTLAMAGMEKHDRFLTQFNIVRIYVPCLRFMKFLLEKRCAASRYEGIEAVQVGLPFRNYPVFPEFEVDYLITAPTTFSFRNERGKQEFLRVVLKLLDQIPSTDTIAYKPHNGYAEDYFAPRVHYLLGKLALLIPWFVPVIARAAKRSSGRVNRHLERILTSLLHLRVLKRVTPMSMLTDYSDISVEAFFPRVRKGVIGGLSNTTWGALYFGLNYYNCVDLVAWRQMALDRDFKNPAGFLDVNLEFFGVPFCSGSLAFTTSDQTIVTDVDRKGDLISAISQDLMSVNV